MVEVKLNLGERSYPIFIGSGILKDAGNILLERGLKNRILVVTNPTVAVKYLHPLMDSLADAGLSAESILVPDGEVHKNLEEANRLYERLITGKFDRKSVLIALGGGVIGDLTGFAAATYLRGVRFVQIPTTLLAQVDSSIGGKVAVNHPRGKNLIGAFYQPSLVMTDVNTLMTLPGDELSSGMAEVIKHGIILDEHYFEFVLGSISAIRKTDPEVMTAVVEGSCRIKGHVVENDEKETGLRAILNFGHTIGHALETVTHYTGYKHGQAVGLGMLGAVMIATETGLLETRDLEPKLRRVLDELRLPTVLPGLPIHPVCEALTLDKKVADSRIHWVLPQNAGHMVIRDNIPLSVVENVLERMGGVR